MEKLYESLQGVALVAATLFTTFWAKNYKVSRLKAFPIAVISQFLGFVLVFLLTWIENGFTGFGAQNAVRAYVFNILFGILEAKLFKIDFLTVLDFQAATIPLCYGIGHFACLAENCCAGFYYQEGTAGYAIAQALTGTSQLPNQIFESVSSLLIFAIIVIIAIKTKFKVTGYLFALYHVLFGGTRFLWEFLRDNEKIIVFGPMTGAKTLGGKEAVWGISSLAIWALAILAVGIIMFVVFKKYHNRNNESENNNTNVVSDSVQPVEQSEQAT